jgi:FlaA1/EpsC-like NDP-sugar epimerase
MSHYKRIFLLPLDFLFVGFSCLFAYLVRFDGHISEPHLSSFWVLLGASLVLKPLVFVLSGFYRRLWRYASIDDLIYIVRSVAIASALSCFVFLVFMHFQGYSRSVLLLDWVFLNVFIFSRSLIWRVLQERKGRASASKGKRVLIIGAGEAGRRLLQECRSNKDLQFNVVGFLDDDSAKVKASIHGVKVLGRIAEVGKQISSHSVEKVILAMPSTSSHELRQIARECLTYDVKVQTLPPMKEMLSGAISGHVRDIQLEDLLGRKPAVLQKGQISKYLAGKRVLITGAGGSIGSELCRQVSQFEPACLVLFDNAETPLFNVEREISKRFPDVPLRAIIGDVRDRDRVNAVFDEVLPEVVFHAAAYKHVPMMEHNPAEAVNNNVYGSKVLADTADTFGVQHFVMVSTDKAVNPTNVMGATKRTAEMYVQSLAKSSKTHFVTVRFGNVLGSNGSVIPTFKEQIANGGPVTVTDPEITRFFMTIPEASQLVLQAGSMGRGGEIFLLDMGEPVKIVKLAEDLIRLSGLKPHEDIMIEYTGLRPGEKLYEELLLAGEDVSATTHEMICVAKSETFDKEVLTRQLETLFASAKAMELKKVVLLLQQIVPEFKPTFQGHRMLTPTNVSTRQKVVPLVRQTERG